MIEAAEGTTTIEVATIDAGEDKTSSTSTGVGAITTTTTKVVVRSSNTSTAGSTTTSKATSKKGETQQEEEKGISKNNVYFYNVLI